MFDTQLRAAPSNRNALIGVLTNLSELLGITIWALLGLVVIAAVRAQARRLVAARRRFGPEAPKHVKSGPTGCDGNHGFNAPATWVTPRG